MQSAFLASAVNKIIKRGRQFFRAVFSKMAPADYDLVDRYLDDTEKRLFYNMDAAVQKHCVNVALTVLADAHKYPVTDLHLLIKAALLHDIGKTRGSFTLFDRVIYVLVNKISPRLTVKLARPAQGQRTAGFRRAFYTHLVHAELGADLAAKAGLSKELVYLLANHHNKSAASGSPGLSLLIMADELN